MFLHLSLHIFGMWKCGLKMNLQQMQTLVLNGNVKEEGSLRGFWRTYLPVSVLSKAENPQGPVFLGPAGRARHVCHLKRDRKHLAARKEPPSPRYKKRRFLGQYWRLMACRPWPPFWRSDYGWKISLAFLWPEAQKTESRKSNAWRW